MNTYRIHLVNGWTRRCHAGYDDKCLWCHLHYTSAEVREDARPALD